MPLAEKLLTKEDWAKCEAALRGASRSAIRSGGEKDLEKLYARLRSLSPTQQLEFPERGPPETHREHRRITWHRCPL